MKHESSDQNTRPRMSHSFLGRGILVLYFTGEYNFFVIYLEATPMTTHTHTSPHLSSSGPVAHTAEVHLLRLALSAATRLASFQQFHPSTCLSYSTVDRHVVFGRPTFLLPSSIQVNTVSHLLFLSIRRICPNHFIFLT